MDDVIIKWDTPQATSCGCGSKPVYFRRYEGNYYCEQCLIHQVEKRFRKTLADNNLVEKGDKIAVGLSGGKDSSVLLYLLHKHFSNVAEIIAITIDEGIAGYRDRSIVQAQKLAGTLGMEHRIFSFRDAFSINVDEIKTENYCTFCGVLRRQLLNKAAAEIGADKLAIGHNLDDEAQSILMNVVRGDFTGFQRLGASGHDGFVRRVKPLRDIPEKEIKLYAILQGIGFYDSECPHSFNNVRRDVQKMINDLEEKYPGTKMQILSFYNKSRVNTKTEKEAMCCKICGSPSSHNLCKACELSGRIDVLQNSP